MLLIKYEIYRKVKWQSPNTCTFIRLKLKNLIIVGRLTVRLFLILHQNGLFTNVLEGLSNIFFCRKSKLKTAAHLQQRELVDLKWHMRLLSMIQKREDKKIALVVDTSTVEVRSILINNIVKLFEQVKPDTILVQADFKIRSITPVKADTIKYHTHGKASYTEVLEWAHNEKIDTLFYITDVTGFIYEEIKTVDYELYWLVPDEFLPKVPFGKAIKVA